MYTGDELAPDDESPADEPPAAPEDEPDGALAYTSYWVPGYTSPRIWTDAVRIWETTVAVVTVPGGAAVSAASCCGDFTKEAPISPPTASKAAPMPTPSSTRRRRTSRDPRVAGCVTRSSVSPTMGLTFSGASQEAARSVCESRVNGRRGVHTKPEDFSHATFTAICWDNVVPPDDGNLLVVDDEPFLREAVAASLRFLGFEVTAT